MKHEIFIHNHLLAIALERESYKGGRNEAFYIGKLRKHISVLDFNSLYPSVMIDNLFPTEIIKYREQNNLRTLKEDIEKYLVIAELTIKIDKPIMGIKGERLLFPIGTFKGVFCFPEIERLLKDNCIKSVGRVACYKGEKIFKEYVTFFYNERLKAKLKGDKIKDEMLKIFLNSLYGKFGQLKKDNEIYGECDINETWSKKVDIPIKINGLKTGKTELVLLKAFGGKIFKCVNTKDEVYNSFPAIASFCTSYARMRLLEAIEICGWDNIYYCDTDSLFVNDIGLKNLKSLIDNKELGKLKLEYECTSMNIRGCKDYEVTKKGENKSISKIKGIPKSSKKINSNTFSMMKFSKFNTCLHDGNLSNITIKPMTKTLNRKYVKGVRLANGKVEPIKMEI